MTDIRIIVPLGVQVQPAQSSSWPAYGAHCQAAANVSAIDMQLGIGDYGPGGENENAPYSDWQRKKDLIYLQGRYPTASRVENTYNGLVAFKADNTNVRVVEYIYPNRTADDGTTTILGLAWETVEENSGESVWRGVDVASSSLIYDDQGRIFLNPNYEGTDPANGKATFIDAFWDKLQAKSGSGAAYNLRQLFDGVFWDSMDVKDLKPDQRNVTDTGSVNIDYLKPKSSGNTDPALYRNGIKYGVQQFRAKFGGDQAQASNGGRDGAQLDFVTSSNEWAGFWDTRLSEHWQVKIRLEKKDGINEIECTANNMGPRLLEGLQEALMSAEMIDRTETNRLGKGMTQLDYVFTPSSNLEQGWSGPAPNTVSDIPQDFYEAARFVCGIACLEDKFIAAPVLQRGPLPFPYMDEFVYDPGEPIGGTPSIGTIDNTDPAFPFTIRTADDGNFYWQEYENVLWVVNLNTPTGNSDWPQATEDTVTLPDPGVGKVWRYADSNYTNGSRTTGATAAENQSPLVNDGSLTGATINMKRWHARMLVRSDS